MPYTLAEAAMAIGTNKTTILRAIKSSKRATTAIVLIAAAALMAVGYLASGKRSASAPPVDRVSGYDELGECSATTSFDGRHWLALYSDGKAELTGMSSDETKAGRWELRGKLYRVTFAGRTAFYSRMEVDDLACFLVKSDATAADLPSSWFAIPPQRPAPGSDDARRALAPLSHLRAS